MLKELKTYLNISWEDEDIDKKLGQLIQQSEQAINNLMGVKCNFSQSEDLKELLFNRIRYAYNNSLEYFEPNFSSEILRLQLKIGVDSLEGQETSPQADQ